MLVTKKTVPNMLSLPRETNNDKKEGEENENPPRRSSFLALLVRTTQTY